MSPQKISFQTILFFDGVCGLCNRSVDFLIRSDQHNRLLFAPLQGETAKEMLPEKTIADLSSMVLLDSGNVYYKSTAVLRSLKRMGGFWPIFSAFLLIPAFLRDPIYNLVARFRYRVFGKKESCRIPSADERDKILM